jgi:D-alanyl-D-alanine carboxypeptidase (penicillin-binding protein 5/6)
MTLIAVALNSPSVYQDLEQMFEYGFNNYSQETIKKSQELSAEVPVANGMETSVMARPEVDLIVAANAQERAQLSYKVLLPDQVAAPVKKGQTVGVCKLYAAGEEAGQVDLVATAAVAAKPSC